MLNRNNTLPWFEEPNVAQLSKLAQPRKRFCHTNRYQWVHVLTRHAYDSENRATTAVNGYKNSKVKGRWNSSPHYEAAFGRSVLPRTGQ